MTDLSLLLSKFLGYGILCGSLMYKVPQIKNIVSAKSSEGISLNSYLMETIGFSITLAYNIRNAYPFSTYGETASILIQNLIVILLIYYYSKRMSQFFVVMLFFAAWQYFLYVMISLDLMRTIQSASIVIFTASKIPQIVTMYNEKTAGALAMPTLFMAVGGTAARVFTTLKEISDPTILFGYCLSLFLNGFIFAQASYYKFVVGQTKKQDGKPAAKGSAPTEKVTAAGSPVGTLKKRKSKKIM